MDCPNCNKILQVESEVDIGVGTIPFEWSCDCGLYVSLGSNKVNYLMETDNGLEDWSPNKMVQSVDELEQKLSKLVVERDQKEVDRDLLDSEIDDLDDEITELEEQIDELEQEED